MTHNPTKPSALDIEEICVKESKAVSGCCTGGQMSKTPIEMILDTVEWVAAAPAQIPEDATPYAAHEGILEIGGAKLRCYRLNNGQAVFHADDFHAFFDGLTDPTIHSGEKG